MLPTFVIGLREGLEAALIVGIIAAFLRNQGRRDLLRSVLLGTGVAVALCLGVGIALRSYSQQLPQRQQEGLETVIGILAVAMVTYMVVWMKRNSRTLKGQLEGLAAGALDGTSPAGRAMVLMAFLAVIREGLETVVFLLAAFNESGSGSAAGVGALLGILVAVGLGYGIYRGGVRLNLSRFFRVTGVVLVLVAAGLVVNALHTAHEAGWLDRGQQTTVDLSWLVRPGTVQESLLTGMLGVQSHPVLIEVIGWLAYLIPVGCYVAWPQRDRRPSRGLLLGAAFAAVACSGVAVAAPSTHDAGSGPAPASTASAARTIAVTVTAAHGCTPSTRTMRAGGVTFTITNKDATAVSEVELLSGSRIVGEKENVPPGFNGRFAVQVGAGTYTLYCPGAAHERSTMAAVGTATGAGDAQIRALLASGTRSYAQYVDTQVAGLVTAVQRLDTALHGTNLAAAQDAYMRARPYYERIEPVAESFQSGGDNIDADLDARDGDVPAAKWRGFHRIEQTLFAKRSLAGVAGYGDRLVSDAEKLQSLTAGLTYQATELANGAQELLDEVAASKITGEEERYSHIDLLDFADNDAGAERAFSSLAPALRRIDASLVQTISARFSALDELVDTYRTNANASGFVRYTALTAADKQALAAAVKAVQEPLSTVASKVADG